jgi:hypothetical protein
MNRWLKGMVSTLALTLGMGLAAAPAQAGFGATAFLAPDFGSNDLGAPMWAPSVDYRFNGLLFQLPALNLIGGLTNKHLDLGLAFSGIVAKGQMGTDFDGVFFLGGNARYFAPTDAKIKNASAFEVMLKARLGMEVKKNKEGRGMGFGVYVVPRLGISTFADSKAETAKRELGLGWGGGLELSTWFSGR